MRNAVSFLTGNLVLNLCICSWIAAQGLKVVIYLIKNGKLDFRYLFGSGGMPSSHSSVVCTLASSVGYLAGWYSIEFAITAVVAFVVMYDAANVRKAAGEQARILNHIMENWKEMQPSYWGKELKELLGHTPLQVFAGAILGVLIGLLGTYLYA